MPIDNRPRYLSEPRNSDQLSKSRHDELRNLREFYSQDGKKLTRMEAFEILLSGSYVRAKDHSGTIHRVSLDGHTEYLEACPS